MLVSLTFRLPAIPTSLSTWILDTFQSVPPSIYADIDPFKILILDPALNPAVDKLGLVILVTDKFTIDALLADILLNELLNDESEPISLISTSPPISILSNVALDSTNIVVTII